VIPRLTIGITTRDRPEALENCLASLSALAAFDPEVIVFDDGSQPPAGLRGFPSDGSIRVIRDERAPGTIVGRNVLVGEARASLVLLLDDDAQILSDASVSTAMALMDADPRIGAVGFAQAEADGTPWAAGMQPSRAERVSVIAAYIGFAHLVRRDVFLSLGGYRELFVFYGEEKDYCLRMYAAGYLTVYDPRLRVAHVPAAQNRSRQRYLRLVARNDCLQSVFNDPIERLAWMLPARFLLYFRMRRQWKVHDPWGGFHLLADVARRLPRALRGRAPIARKTLAAWRHLHRTAAAYKAPSLNA